MLNSVAGGGSFLSFPALVFAGVPAISANATNNAAMWAGTIGSARGYREEVREHRSLLLPVLLASAAGSLIGASLTDGFKTDLLRRILIAAIPFTALAIALSFKKVPFIVRLVLHIGRTKGTQVQVFAEHGVARSLCAMASGTFRLVDCWCCVGKGMTGKKQRQRYHHG